MDPPSQGLCGSPAGGRVSANFGFFSAKRRKKMKPPKWITKKWVPRTSLIPGRGGVSLKSPWVHWQSLPTLWVSRNPLAAVFADLKRKYEQHKFREMEREAQQQEEERQASARCAPSPTTKAQLGGGAFFGFFPLGSLYWCDPHGNLI